MANKYMQRCSTSMSVRKCQLKNHNEVLFCTHFMAIIKETDDNKCWQWFREIWALIFCWWGCKLVSSIWKRACQLFKCLKSDFPGGPLVKNPPANSGDTSSVLGSAGCPGGGNGNLLQCPCMDHHMERGTWCGAVHGVKKSWRRLSDWAHWVICRLTLLGKEVSMLCKQK